MKKKIIFILLAMLPVVAIAQTFTAQYTKEERKAAKQWVRSGVWRNGFTKAKPDKTVNLVDFQRQYEKNPEQWKALFAWLENTDLMALTKGKHHIPGTKMTASVQDDTNKPIEKRRSESHRRNIDFQYVVSGIEGFAVIDHESSTPNCEYDAKKDVIHYDYSREKAHFFSNHKNCFNIFFPGDWHIAKVNYGKKKLAGKFRVIVIKVDYK